MERHFHPNRSSEYWLVLRVFALLIVSFGGGVVTRQTLEPGNNVVEPIPYATSHTDKACPTTVETVLFSRGVGLTCYLAILFLSKLSVFASACMILTIFISKPSPSRNSWKMLARETADALSLIVPPRNSVSQRF